MSHHNPHLLTVYLSRFQIFVEQRRSRDMIREEVLIPATAGIQLGAWIYKPSTPGPHPVIIMEPGLGAVKKDGIC